RKSRPRCWPCRNRWPHHSPRGGAAGDNIQPPDRRAPAACSGQRAWSHQNPCRRESAPGIGDEARWILRQASVYKSDELGTLPAMLKRILSIATGVLLGTVLATGTIRLTSEWGWWPYGEVNQSAN